MAPIVLGGFSGGPFFLSFWRSKPQGLRLGGSGDIKQSQEGFVRSVRKCYIADMSGLQDNTADHRNIGKSSGAYITWTDWLPIANATWPLRGKGDKYDIYMGFSLNALGLRTPKPSIVYGNPKLRVQESEFRTC